MLLSVFNVVNEDFKFYFYFFLQEIHSNTPIPKGYVKMLEKKRCDKENSYFIDNFSLDK